MKVIINTDFGGFIFPEEVIDLYNQRTGQSIGQRAYYGEGFRDNHIMIDILEKYRRARNSGYSSLEVVEIPDDYDYWINDYDGLETLYLMVREDRLRELIDAGDKDAIVDYVMRSVRGFTGE